MSLLRFVARSMFASAFIIDGVKKVSKPSECADEARAFTEKVVPLMQRVVPAPYSSSIPESSETWVRVGGAAQILGGLMFATGLGRRFGALLLAKSSILNLAIALPAKDASQDEKEAARPVVMTRVALLGASMLAARDTQGQPSLGWRAGHAAKVTEKKISGVGDDISKSAHKAIKAADKKSDELSKKASKKAKKLSKKLESVTS